jgi:gas vesicle structural protein
MESNVIDQSKDVTLLEVLDRVLNKGIVLTGDLVISVADIDLVYVGVKLLLSSVETIEQLRYGNKTPEQTDNDVY